MTIRVGRLEVETPDHVVLRYTLAGIGNRGFAALLDFVIAFLIVFGPYFGYGLMGSPGGGGVAAALIDVLLLVGWSYFIVLEWLWNGQTVGKRVFGLRVINEDGTPAGFVAIFVRNLVRLVDFLPGFYGLGLISIVLNSRSQRLGDLAAGTYVVRAPKPALDWLSLRTAPRWALVPTAAVGREDVRSLPAEAQRLVREFASRESHLSERDRARVAKEIAASVRPRVRGIDEPDDVAFVRIVAAGIRAAGDRR